MDEAKKLNTGVEIPGLGLGTWKLSDDEARDSVVMALQAGYRLIDTAKIYGNERGVGEGLRQSGVAREKVFVTTKLWNSDQGYHTARAAFEESLDKLGLEYVDLYLIHWPATEQRHNAWRALEGLYEEGRAKAVGVSNYEVEQLQELLERSDTVPAVNQIEFHPFIYKKQKPILDFCAKRKIIVEAYSPLNQGSGIDVPVIEEMAKKHKKTNAQIMLRWCIQHGTVPIPKSSHPDRIRENIEVFRFELSEEEIQTLDKLSRD